MGGRKSQMPMRLGQLLALAALAALGAFAAPAAASNMCKNAGDFSASATVSASTCQAHNDNTLAQLPAASWDAVTCESMVSTVAYSDVSVFSAIGTSLGAACCGSLAKTRCFDSTVCDVDTDFNGAVDLGALGLGSSGSTCESQAAHFLVTILGKFSWNDVTCENLASTVFNGQESVLQNLRNWGHACCGSLPKTRCFDSMCKVDADFSATAAAGLTIQTGNGDMPLTCGGQYGVAGQALTVWKQATGRGPTPLVLT